MEASRLRLVRAEPTQIGLVMLLLASSVVAWLLTDDRMAGMDHGPGSDLGSLGFYASVWVVMMAAMMFPSIAPIVRSYGLVQARRRQRASLAPATVLFVAGYLVAWTTFGLAAYTLITGFERLDIQALAWDEGGRWLVVGVIAAAALYQLTPAKDACLTRCRNHRDFLIERWRDGSCGALRLGAEHGGWCVGCCWALMASLFALGVMSVAWMAVVAGLIAVEKTLPWRRVATYGTAAVLLTLGVLLLAAPDAIPALTVPGGDPMNEQPMEPMGSPRQL
jgi:predicted metal-binding membrane protein